jgi:hypothetical protein
LFFFSSSKHIFFSTSSKTWTDIVNNLWTAKPKWYISGLTRNIRPDALVKLEPLKYTLIQCFLSYTLLYRPNACFLNEIKENIGQVRSEPDNAMHLRQDRPENCSDAFSERLKFCFIQPWVYHMLRLHDLSEFNLYTCKWEL